MTGDGSTAMAHPVRWAICAWRRICTICGCSVGIGFGLLFAAFGASAAPKVPADLARQVRVSRLLRPWGLDRTGATVSVVLDLWNPARVNRGAG